MKGSEIAYIILEYKYIGREKRQKSIVWVNKMVWIIRAYLDEISLAAASSSLREDNSNNQSVKTQGFSENENQNHSDEDLFLLGVCSDSCITNDTNGETGSL